MYLDSGAESDNPARVVHLGLCNYLPWCTVAAAGSLVKWECTLLSTTHCQLTTCIQVFKLCNTTTTNTTTTTTIAASQHDWLSTSNWRSGLQTDYNATQCHTNYQRI